MLRKRIFSGLIALSMVISTMAMSVYAENTETTNSVIVYGSDENTNNIEENLDYGLTLGDGAEYVSRGTTVRIKGGNNDKSEYFPSEGFVFDYAFNVENEGVYELSSFIASDVNNNFLSRIAIAVNDGVVKAINSDTYLTATDVLYKEDKAALMKEYTTDLKFYLNEGTNHFKFVIPTHNVTGNGTLAYFDKAEFTYVNEEDLENTKVLGTDAYIEKTAELTYAPQTNALPRVRLSTPVNAPLPQKIKYEFEILAPGCYEVELKTAVFDNAGLSKYNIKIDDTVVEINKDNLLTYTKESDNVNMTATLRKKFNLSAGKHTFEIELTAYRTSGSAAANLYFESAEFNRISGYAEHILGTDTYVEKTTELKVEAQSAALPRVRLSTPVDAPLPQKVKYEFDVAVPGYYSLDFNAGVFDNAGLSKYTIKVDDKAIEVNESALATYERESDKTNMTATLKEKFNLSAGKHTFEIELTAYRTSGSAAANQYFKYAIFNRESNYTEVIYGSDTNTNNIEENSEYGLTIGDGAEYKTRGTTVRIKGGSNDLAEYFPSEGFVFDYAIDVETAGVYKLSSIIASDVNNKYLSKIGVAVNNSVVKEINSTTYKTTELITASNGTTQLLAEYATDLQFYLNKGINHFMFVIPTHNVIGSGTLAYFDKAELTYVDEQIDDLKITYKNNYVEAGTTAKMKYDVVAYTNKGTAVYISKDGIQLTNGDTNIAEIDNDGMIAAKSKGNTNINVTASACGITKTASVPVYVTENNEITYSTGFFSNAVEVLDVTDELAKVTAKAVVYNGNETAKDVVIYIAVYDGERLEYCAVKEYCGEKALKTGENRIEVSIDDFDFEAKHTVKMFVWGNELQPLMDSNEI